jgi:hypothetical protein
MTRFTLVLAIAIVAPFAANAAVVMPPQSPPDTFMTTAKSASLHDQLSHLNGEVLALNNQVQRLTQQEAPGTAYTPELGGIIPSGG